MRMNGKHWDCMIAVLVQNMNGKKMYAHTRIKFMMKKIYVNAVHITTKNVIGIYDETKRK